MAQETSDSAGVIVGVDIGGTKIHAAAFDHKFQFVAEHRAPTNTGSADMVTSSVIGALAALASKLNGRPVDAIGIGIPGVVDPLAGSVRQAVNLGIDDEPLPLVKKLIDACGAPCAIDNDVNVAALGAHHLLRDQHDVSDLAYLSIGTGIAAGIILDGCLHRGHRGVAGEIGHFPVVTEGPECECGLQGCLEAVASGRAIARLWPATVNAGSAEALLLAAERGEPEAVAVLEPIAEHLARAIYLLAVTYDVDCVVIGGGVADLGELLLGTITASLRRLEMRSSFVRSLELPHRIVLKPAGPVGAVGAALLTRDPSA